MYKIDSPHAEEFINHDEIMATLDYAKANKDNRELIRSIIDKARDCKGLSHREAAVLLECDDNDLLEDTFFNVPKISVNCKRINSISSSSTMRIISFLLYFAILNLLIIAKSYNLIVLHLTAKQIKSTAYCHIQMVLSKLPDAF